MRILVVEDERKLLHLLSSGLRTEGYSVDEANNGQSGLELALNNHYDFIILDIMLPLVNGTDVLRSLRDNNQRTPILMLTANGSINSKVENFEAGADDYLTKPFSFAELLIRIKALLRRVNDTSSSIKINDFELDRVSHQVTRNKKHIHLSVKEYALLEYLARNAGRVLSRAMIIQQVWDHSFEGLPNIVDIYISQLRAKIDNGRTLKLIQTERGIGYRFGAEGSK